MSTPTGVAPWGVCRNHRGVVAHEDDIKCEMRGSTTYAYMWLFRVRFSEQHLRAVNHFALATKCRLWRGLRSFPRRPCKGAIRPFATFQVATTRPTSEPRFATAIVEARDTSIDGAPSASGHGRSPINSAPPSSYPGAALGRLCPLVGLNVVDHDDRSGLDKLLRLSAQRSSWKQQTK